MFDSVIHPEAVRRSRWGTGVVIAIFIHVALVILAAYLSTRKPSVEEKPEVKVVFKAAAPPPPPPPPPAATHKVEHKVVKKFNTIVQPKEIPKEKPPEAEPAKEDEGVEGGVEGGVAGGVIGGVVGGVVGNPLPKAVGPLPFDDSMVKPSKISGPGPEGVQYTQKAADAEVEGLMIVKCVLTVQGVVRDCRVIRSLPYMDRAATDALERSRYKPATQGGRPVDVEYTFKINLQLPH